MDMILLDWTRMGKAYCLAGVVAIGDRYYVVRPLPGRHRDVPVRNVGWSPHLLDGHCRWEVFELVGFEDAVPQPPHLEDGWVRTLHPRRRSASADERRAVLQATAACPDEPIFGESLQLTRTSAYLPPGQGLRSLATVLVPGDGVTFSASWREGADEPDIRVTLAVPTLSGRLLMMVKDHHLLLKAGQAAKGLTELVQTLNGMVRQMGEQVAVRLGLSRGFSASPEGGESRCWLMVDGIFSLSDPQP